MSNDVAEMKHKKPHTKLGIIAFIFSLAALASIVAVIVKLVDVGRMVYPEVSLVALIILGLMVIVSALLSLAGIILGIIGVSSTGRRKIFAILGLVFNIVIFVFIVFLLLLGHFARI